MKKKEIRFVDMAIYIDENIKKENHDVKKIYDYLYKLSLMLLSKRSLLNAGSEYITFALEMATRVYMRMTDSRTKLDPSDPNYLPPIKSSLNYLKATIYPKMINFVRKERYPIQSLDYSLEDTSIIDSTVVQQNSNELLKVDICSYFDTLERILKREIEKGFYGKDKVLSYKLYVSALISLARNYILTNRDKHKLINFIATRAYNKKMNTNRIIYRTNYEHLLNETIKRQNETSTILYDLPEEYYDYVRFIVSKSKQQMIDDIRDLSEAYKLSDESMKDIYITGLEMTQGET